MKKILAISTKRTDAAEAMLAYLEGRMPQVQIDYAVYDDLVISFIDGKMRVSVENTGLDLADYDMVYFKSSVVHDITATYVQYALRNDVKVTDVAKGAYAGGSKLYTYGIIVPAGISVPNSLFAMPGRLVGAYDRYEQALGLPFVLKGIHASRGDVNEVIRSRDDFDRVVAVALTSDKKAYLIGQSFVPNEGDLRILVFGGEVQLVIHRQRADESTHLNNTSQGGRATIVPIEELPAEVIAASRSAATLSEIGIAGVDMVKDKETGKWYCFEVNEGPQMATGSYRQSKWNELAKYFMTELEK